MQPPRIVIASPGNVAEERKTVIPPVFIVAFSGHRPQEGVNGRRPVDLAACQPLVREALVRFKEQAAKIEGSIQLITSCAEGADLAACRAAEELGVPVHLILPLPESLFAQDFAECPDAWAEARSFIQRGRARQNGWSLRIAKSTHERSDDDPLNGPSCYADTNHEILYHADALITVCLDITSPPSSTAGAAQVWHDAARRGLPRININPGTKTLDEPSDLARLTDSANKHSGIAVLHQLAHHVGELTCQGTTECLEKLYDAFSDEAGKASKYVRNAVVISTCLHGSASLLAAAALALALTYHHAEFYKPALCLFAALELVLIGIAELLHHRMHHRGESWLDCRAAAEFLRPLPIVRKAFDPLQTLVDNHAPQWRRFILSANLLSEVPQPFPSLAAAKSEYGKERIDDQISFFKKKSTEAAPRSKRLYQVMRWSSKLAFIVVLIAVIVKANAWHQYVEHPEEKYQTSLLGMVKDFALYFLPVALPLIAGVLLALRHSLDLSRREHRYALMAEQLEEAKHDLNAAHTPFAFAQVITRTEQTLLNERLEFDVAQRIGLEH